MPVKSRTQSFETDGLIKDNHVAGGSNFSEDDKTHRFTVPSGKRWKCYGGSAKPDVSGTIYADLWNENDEYLGALLAAGAGTAIKHFPEAHTEDFLKFPIVMKAGWYIEVVFGASQTANAHASCLVSELKE